MLSLYTLVEDSHAIAGFITNILLMYTIVKFSRKSLGPYKELLLIFAAYEVFLVVLHTVLKPRVVNTTIFGVAADWDNRYLTTLYCVCNTVPFALTIIDFLYRYWCIARPHLIQLFYDWRFNVFFFFLWFFLCIQVLTEDGEEIARGLLVAETGRRLGKEIKEGWLIMNHWKNNELNVPNFLASITFNTLMIGCFSIAITLGWLCYHHIYVLGGTLNFGPCSSNAKEAVRVRTAIPLLFVYSPYLCVVNLPLFRLPIFYMDDACMLLTSCFLAWDRIIAKSSDVNHREGNLSSELRYRAIERSKFIHKVSEKEYFQEGIAQEDRNRANKGQNIGDPVGSHNVIIPVETTHPRE
ncbi:hypothetical protein PRIPAC_77643 [Pristionchus pacificus]|uniref:G protein-coupled receptor n=1 Tax=Pristionchus pacificus TaxID=54126 RepID=A0A2A6CLE9_PRIPA|nr:hypothetical protein PRIPAC_77643 [Pristionchus pacificus]|eukprot:PDM79034.1 G protein-coupled receptor [Pristionchus pacificus]